MQGPPSTSNKSGNSFLTEAPNYEMDAGSGFTLIRPDGKSSSLPADTQAALNEVYAAAGWITDPINVPVEPAGGFQERICSTIVSCFPRLNVDDVCYQESRTVDIYQIPAPLLDAMMVLMMSGKPDGHSTVLPSDFTYAMDLIQRHPSATNDVREKLSFYRDHIDLENTLRTGIARHTMAALEHGRLSGNSTVKLEFVNLFENLPLDVFDVMAWYLSAQGQGRLFQTSSGLNNRFPSLVERDIERWGNKRNIGEPVPPNRPRVLFSIKGIQFVQSRIVNCAANNLIQMKAGKAKPEDVKEYYREKRDELRALLPKQLPKALSVDQIRLAQKFFSGYEQTPQFQEVNISSQESANLSLMFKQLHENIDALNVQGECVLSEEQVEVLIKYIADGLFDEVYFQRLLPDQKRELLNLLMQGEMQRYLDSIVLEENALSLPDNVRLKDIHIFLTEVLNRTSILDLLAKRSVNMSQLVDAWQKCNMAGCRYFLQNSWAMLYYCENGLITPAELISLPLSTAKVLSDISVYKCYIRIDKYHRDDNDYQGDIIQDVVKPRIKKIMSAESFVTDSILDRVVKSRLYLGGPRCNHEFISIEELFELNENGHKLIRNRKLMDEFSRFVQLMGNSYGKKALFEYWDLPNGAGLKDTGYKASDVYRYTNKARYNLLKQGKYDEYVALIGEDVLPADKKNPENCIIS